VPGGAVDLASGTRGAVDLTSGYRTLSRPHRWGRTLGRPRRGRGAGRGVNWRRRAGVLTLSERL